MSVRSCRSWPAAAASVPPAGPARRKVLTWANRPPFGRPPGPCRGGHRAAVRSRASNWPGSERRRRLAAGFSPAISGLWKQAGITVSPAGSHRLFLTPHWPSMQSHADIEEGRPGRRRRRVAWPSPGTGPGGQSAPISASGRFYSALGLAGGDGSRSGNWLELGSLGGSLGLHIVRESHGDGAREVELSFVSGSRWRQWLRGSRRRGSRPGRSWMRTSAAAW